LRGGWVGHRLYLQEVRKMATEKLVILEQLGISLAQRADVKKHVNELRAARWNELYGILQSYVRQGWLKHEEFYILLPPSGYEVASEVRDVLLAVIYEWQRCQEQDEEFPALTEQALPSPDETLLSLQRIGEQLIERLPNLSRWVGRLRTARSPFQIRGVYLSAVERGAIGFDDFLFLAPFGDAQRLWLLRDYLLAFFFDRAREALLEEEEIGVGVEASSLEAEQYGGDQ
jgi:CRISPR-associated protein Cst1